MTFLLAGDNLPFTIALGLMFGIGLLEILFSVFGPGFSSLIEAGMPDLGSDPSAGNLDATGFEDATPLSKLLGWLRVGQVPLLVLFIVFLTAFGMLGLVIQGMWQHFTGAFIPGWIASVPAFALALPCVRTVGGVIGRLMPKDETSAVSEDSFIGRIAIVTSGTARPGHPAEARLTDQFRQDHYILVEPDDRTEQFESGSHVLLVSRINTVFKAIRNTNTALVDESAS